jgi:3',5'-cyclic-AMP phosphodiesterase
MSACPLLIAQISDLHIKQPGERAYRQVDTAAALTRCVKELNRLKPRPDLVVISGDLVDTPLAAEYDHLKKLLAPLEIEFAAIPGNHDNRELMRTALPDLGYAQPSGPLNSVRKLGNIDIVLLDSTVPGDHHGELDTATLQWLDTTLGTSATRPALLFVHHPPFKTGIAHMDEINMRNAGDLSALIRKHRRARMVGCGHVHRPTLTTFAGVAATICPAPNHAVALDLDGHLPASFMIEPPAFHVHAYFEDEDFGRIVTHSVPIGEFDGPYPFSDSEGNFL